MSDTTTLAPVLAGHIAAVPRLGQPGNALGVDPHTGCQRVTPTRAGGLRGPRQRCYRRRQPRRRSRQDQA
jgi:hypothetical protein